MTQSVREPIEVIFAMQWHKRNIVILLNTDGNQVKRNRHLTASIGNCTYAATASDLIYERVYVPSFEWQFIEIPDRRLQTILSRSEMES